MSVQIYEDQRPSNNEYLLLSSDAYSRFNNNDNLIKEESKELELIGCGWEFVDSHCNPASGYAGVLYKNTTTKQIVISHRGTDTLNAFIEDLYSIVYKGQGLCQKQDAYILINKGLKFLLANRDYHRLSFTGHSLGGYLAQLSILFALNYLRKSEYQDLSVSFNVVTFDSPGCSSSWKKLQSNLKISRIDPEKEDIINLMSYPNLINSFGHQIGTIYQIPVTVREGWMAFSVLRTWERHSLVNFVNWFKAPCSHPLLMVDWPVGLEYRKFDEIAELKNGKYELRNSDSNNVQNPYRQNWVVRYLFAIPNYYFGFWKKNSNQEMSEKIPQLSQYFKSFDAHIMENTEMSNSSTIPLKHFAPALQQIIEEFKQMKNPNLDKLPKTLGKYLEELNIPVIGDKLKLVQLKSGNDVREFRHEISKWLQCNPSGFDDLVTPDPSLNQNQVQASLIDKECTVGEQARICGNVVIGKRIQISKDFGIQGAAALAESLNSNDMNQNARATLVVSNTQFNGTVENNTVIGAETVLC